MSTTSSKKDIGWKYCYQIEGDKSVRCKFCHHKSNGGITRLKEHLAQTHKGVAPCVSVPDDVKQEIKESLDKIRVSKNKQTELLREIGEGPRGTSTQSSKVGSDEGSSIGFSGGSQSKGKGTLDGFVSSEPRQTTLNSAYKKDLLVDVKRRVGRFIYSAALPFNVVNDPYWLPMVEGIAEYGRGFKPASMHELRTWILKAEVDDINLIYEEHRKSRGFLGCCVKPPLVISVDEPSKGLKIQCQRVKKHSLTEDFWSTSSATMENSAFPSHRSISSISTSNQTCDAHSSAGSSNHPTDLVNPGLLLWNQTRQQWIGNKRSQKHVQVQEPKLSWNATYESLLGINKPFPQPIPLAEMVDFLVDVWEQEGLYD